MNLSRLRSVLPISWVTLRVFLLVAGIEAVQVFLLPGVIGRLHRDFHLNMSDAGALVCSPWLRVGLVLFAAAVVAKEYLIKDEDVRLALNIAGILAMILLQMFLIPAWFSPFICTMRVSGGS